MEFCDAFIALQGDRSNPTDAALAVCSAQLTTDDLNYELTRFLLDSCGFQVQIPKDLVTRADIENILKWIKENKPGIPPGETSLRNSKFFRKCASFFEQVFYLDWNKFANKGNFDTYFSALLDTLSLWNYEPLCEISFVLQLKLITAYLRRADEGLETFQNYKPSVSKYATKVHENTVFYIAANCQIFGNAELYEWIKLDDSFATDENLRSIVWCTKLDKPSVVCHALSIVYSLLRMNQLREKLTRFVQKLMTIFEDLCYTKNRLIFDWICRCCEFIYKYHRENISPKFMEDLLDNLYAEDRRRAKSAAGFWISSVFDPICHHTNIRIILKFLEGKGFDHWKILVDSLIDDYSVIIDWELLVGIILGEDKVPEEIKLTAEEKGGLVMLMAFAIEETCTGNPPDYRMANMKKMDEALCSKFSENVTEILVPRFWDLFRIEYPHKERIQIMLVGTIKFYQFVHVDKEILKQWVKTCTSLFEKCNLPYSLHVVMEVLKTIMDLVLDEEIVELCKSSCLAIRNNYELKLVELINDYFNYPNKYSDLDSDRAKEADGILIRVLCLNRIANFSQFVAFNLPQQILARKIPLSDPILFSITQVSVHLISEHVHRAATDLKDYYDREHTFPENHEDIMKEVDFACKILIIKLVEWYRWTDLAVTTFLCLCRIFGAIKNWPMDEEVKDTLITSDAQVLIARFVESMVWKADDRISKIVDNGTKTFILEGFLKMIEWKLLPLKFVYDPITHLKKTDATYACMKNPLRRFILEMCQLEEEASVVDWLSKWLTGMFRLFPENCMEIVSDFIDLIYPIWKKIQNIVYLVALKGIDFALGKSNRKDKSPKSNLEFLPVLAKFCEYLDQPKKNSIEAFSKQSTFPKDGIKALRSFLKCLKKKAAPRKSEPPKPVAKSSPIMSSRRSSVATFDENISNCSYSSIRSNNSSFADESDLESNCPSERSLIMVRNLFEPNAMFINDHRDGMASDDDSNDVPLAFSTLIEKPDAQTKITGGSGTKNSSKPTSSDESDILLGTSIRRRPISSSDEYTAAKSPPPSVRGQDIVNKSRNPSIQENTAAQSPSPSALVQDILNISQSPSLPSSSVMMRTSEESMDTTLSTRSEELDYQTENASQVLDNVAHLLRKSKSPPMSSASAMLKSSEESADSIRSPRSKELDNQTENASQVLDNVADLLRKSKSPPMSSASAMLKSTEESADSILLSRSKELDIQTENTPEVLHNVADLLNKSRRSPVSSASVMLKSREESADSIFSPRSKELDIQTENTPPVLHSVVDLLNKSRSPPVPSASVMLRSNEESADAILSTQSEKLDIQAESTPQVLDNVADLLNIQSPSADDIVAANKSTSVTESSGDFPVDDVLNNLSMFSSPKESDDQAVDACQVYGSVTELLGDLDSEVPDDDFAVVNSPSVSESSSRISDVVRNFQRASLSNADSESSESSSAAFDKSPVKKKRRSRL